MQFSLTRFYSLFIKQWKENKKIYILGLISLPILMSVVFLITANSSNLTEANQIGIFGGVMIIFGSIFCATLLSEYSPKPKGVRSLILPVSAIEKLLVAIVYGLIIYPILYIVLVYPVLILATYINSEFFGNLNMLATINFFGPLMVVIAISSFVFLCSLIFRKFIIIKTALTLLSLLFIFNQSNNLINKALIGDSQPITFNKEFLKYEQVSPKEASKINFEPIESGGPLSGLHFNTNSYGVLKISPSKPIGAIGSIITMLCCPILLIACFYRLKETEL